MKQKFVAGVTGITVLNLILFCILYSAAGLGPVVCCAICAALTVFVSFIAFQHLLKPVLDLQKKLEETGEENKKAENIRREFVANVTHELKTPLTSISGFIETLQDGAAEDPEIRTKFLDIIAIETARLKRLIEDLLVLSDIENKREVKADHISVRQALERTIEAIRPIADNRHIQIIEELPQGHYIDGSEDRFSQMMVNLIENAIKYSGDGGHVYIASRDLGDKLEVSVRDEGIGIAEEHFDRLFERFYRVDKSRSKKEGGTGLGLSIVEHIAFLLNAELRVESELGKGSVFYVIFPKGGEA